jgi:pimeloyl-ACP methyl ester carboxylesterase
MKPSAQYARLASGLAVHYAEQGDPAGVPVIFLHGVTDSWRSFELLFAHLPRSFRAIALSQRGHGDSDRPEAGYRAKNFSEDLAAFMDALGLERAVIVGHSMGTQGAQRFAIDHPERLLALMLIGAFATMRGNAPAEEFWASEVARLRDPIDPALARAFQESTLAQPIPSGFLDTAVAESLKVPARVWRAAFEGFPARRSVARARQDRGADLDHMGRPGRLLLARDARRVARGNPAPDARGLCRRRARDALGRAAARRRRPGELRQRRGGGSGHTSNGRVRRLTSLEGEVAGRRSAGGG